VKVTKLIGIARMAAESAPLEAKRRVEYRELPARSYLAPCNSPRLPFRWTINPYRGCEFGCKYCYARYTHEFMELRQSEEFERKIFAKQFNPFLFGQELKRLAPGTSIAIGSATDPYQPAERRYRITRQMLEVFARMQGLRLGITTKSNLVTRDIELLLEVAGRHRLGIALTITTVDARLAGLLEPMAPRPDLRLEAIHALSRAGLNVRVSCAPIMPLINDSEASLDALARGARDAGARGLWTGVLFLKPCASQVFFPFLEEHFPSLIRRYRTHYEHSAYLRGAYPEMIQQRVARIAARYGLNRREDEPAKEEWPVNPQLSLFDK